MDAYFDIFSGISGNMVLGALVDLGLDLEKLEVELQKLGLDDEYKIEVNNTEKEGIGGTYLKVALLDNHCHESCDHDEHDQHHHDNEQHDHDHEHDHCHHDHDHSHHQNSEHKHDYDKDCHTNHTHEHGHQHNHEDTHHGCDQNSHTHGHSHGRNLNDIKGIINKSGLSDDIKEKSIAIFTNLARAEAKIHGESIDKIHFHEVGAVDAIVDIVGSVIGLDLLGVDRVFASRVHTGNGFVKCDHGWMPVPAPATMELLQDIPVYSKGIEAELVTPTGAAIITTLAEEFGPRPEMEIKKTGYGAGSRDLSIPNLLRINLGQIGQKKTL